ncbi:MAG TPA: hypothetical protein VGE79_11340 [Niastella sp.]
MKLFSISLIFFLTTIFPSCHFFNLTSEPNWDNLTSFKMYAFNYVKPLNQLKDDEMDTLVSIDIPVDEARRMFKDRIKPTSSLLIYKTMILCRLKFRDAADRRFVISSYGGFFTDLYADRLYKVLPEYHSEWREFVSSYESELLHRNYMKQYPDADTTDRYRGD